MTAFPGPTAGLRNTPEFRVSRPENATRVPAGCRDTWPYQRSYYAADWIKWDYGVILGLLVQLEDVYEFYTLSVRPRYAGKPFVNRLWRREGVTSLATSAPPGVCQRGCRS